MMQRARGDLGALSLMLPVPVGLIVGLFSLMMGADSVYVSFQILLFILIVPILYVIRTDEKYTAAVVLIGFAKTFYISQIISIFIWHAPDAALLNAQLTELGLIVGLVSALVGIVLARLTVAALPRTKPLLSWGASAPELRQMGYLTGIIGLPAQILWTIHVTSLSGDQHGGVGIQSSGAPIFEFLAPLALVSICCFAAEQLLISDRRSFLSSRLVVTLAIYFAAILPLATKTEPLRPLVALFAVALIYRWRPRIVPVASGLVLLLVVMEFFYPAVTLARMTAFGEQRPVAVVFGEIAMKSLVDPSELSFVREYSDNYEMGLHQNYYGRVMGFWDRFTPQVTDQLISGSQYLDPAGLSVFKDAFYEILPQSLGFKKTLDAQSRIEIALTRNNNNGGKVSWSNAGYVGDGFVSGGIVMASAFCLCFGFLGSMTSRLIFVQKTKDPLWIPFLCGSMFVLADSGFVSGTYAFFWGSAIYIGVLYILIRYMAARGSRAIAATMV